MKKRKRTAIAIVVVTIILSIIGLYFLPESTAVQWNNRGEVQKSVSKHLALIIGLCCSAFGVWYWYGKDRSALVGASRLLWEIIDYAVGCIGIFVLMVTLIMNL